MSIEAMKLALEFLEDYKYAEARIELHAAIEQAEKQEPVVWMYQDKSTHEVRFQKHMRSFVDHGAVYEVPLYASPPQREWVGLTDDELLAVMQSAKDFQGRIAMTWVNHENQTYVTDVGNRIARAIEAKLKEKNG